ncbi:MAG: HU family DNA-binding protein, partial [Clostridiales bacterium]|nr:HU family DNA-binding protein [Clostridiales bacterium]
MNKTELVEAMAAKAGTSKKDTEAVLNAFIETVSDELQAKG